MSKRIIVIAALFVFAFILQTNSSSAKESIESQVPSNGKNTAAAVVNGVKIPEKTLEQQLNMIQLRYKSMGMNIPPEKMAALKSKLLSNLVEQEVLYQESRKQGITVNPEAIASELKKIKNKFPSDSEFYAKIKTLGYTEASLKNQIRENLAIQELIDKEILSKIKISPEDEKAYYESHKDKFTKPEQVRARHILIKLAPDASDAEKAEAKKKITEILQKLKKGADFADLAKKYSQGPSSKNGGDLGFFSYRQMVEPFSKAAFALKPGEISGIVKTRFGYHIIKLEEKKPAVVTPFDKAKPALEEQLRREKAGNALDPYIDNLKKNAVIKINLPQASSPDSSMPASQ